MIIAGQIKIGRQPIRSHGAARLNGLSNKVMQGCPRLGSTTPTQNARATGGVGTVAIPQRGGRKTPQRQAYERSARFKQGQRFRPGIEGRISVLLRGRGMIRGASWSQLLLHRWAIVPAPNNARDQGARVPKRISASKLSNLSARL
jgi:hypothetical protein